MNLSASPASEQTRPGPGWLIPSRTSAPTHTEQLCTCHTNTNIKVHRSRLAGCTADTAHSAIVHEAAPRYAAARTVALPAAVECRMCPSLGCSALRVLVPRRPGGLGSCNLRTVPTLYGGGLYKTTSAVVACWATDSGGWADGRSGQGRLKVYPHIRWRVMKASKYRYFLWRTAALSPGLRTTAGLWAVERW